MRAVYGIFGLLLSLAPKTVLGAEPCSEGDWNCRPGAAPPPSGSDTAEPSAETSPPSADADGAAREPSEGQPRDEESSAPPPVIYETRDPATQEQPPPVDVVERGDATPEETAEPRATEIGVRPRTDRLQPYARERWDPLWGVSGRLQTALGASRGRNVEMYGLGLALRYRPVPHFAVDFGVDFLSGRDWHGQRRAETAFSASALVYFNPKATFQVYLPMGLHGSGAQVEAETPSGRRDRSYRYFGAHVGIGGEIRLTPAVALPIELLGFVRGRTDSAARRDPEFIDEKTNLVTNTSGGGMLRAGVVVYW